MSHNQEPGRPQPYQRLTADQHEAMASWPHTPSPELFNRAARAHHLVYNENPEPPGNPENPPAKPVHLRDFRLAEIMDDIKHAHHFRIQAVQEFRDLRRLNPARRAGPTSSPSHSPAPPPSPSASAPSPVRPAGRLNTPRTPSPITPSTPPPSASPNS